MVFLKHCIYDVVPLIQEADNSWLAAYARPAPYNGGIEDFFSTRTNRAQNQWGGSTWHDFTPCSWWLLDWGKECENTNKFHECSRGNNRSHMFYRSRFNLSSGDRELQRGKRMALTFVLIVFIGICIAVWFGPELWSRVNLNRALTS